MVRWVVSVLLLRGLMTMMMLMMMVVAFLTLLLLVLRQTLHSHRASHLGLASAFARSENKDTQRWQSVGEPSFDPSFLPADDDGTASPKRHNKPKAKHVRLLAVILPVVVMASLSLFTKVCVLDG